MPSCSLALTLQFWRPSHRASPRGREFLWACVSPIIDHWPPVRARRQRRSHGNKSLENNERRQQTKCLRVRLVNNLVPRHLVCVQQIEQTTNCAARDVHDSHSHRVAPALRVGVGGNPRSRLYRQTGLVGQRQVIIQVLITSRSQLVLKKDTIIHSSQAIG